VIGARVGTLIRRVTALAPNERPTVDEVLQDEALAESGTMKKPSSTLLRSPNMEAAFFMCQMYDYGNK
jgi:hypothetical protein